MAATPSSGSLGGYPSSSSGAAGSSGETVGGAVKEECATMAAPTDERSTATASCRDWTRLAAMPDSSSDGSSRPRRDLAAFHLGGFADFEWDAIRLGHRIRPHQRCAHCADDVRLLSGFFELAGIDDVQGEAVRLLLKALKFLRLCDYSSEDICSIIAHASAYFMEVHNLCGNQMDGQEVGNVLATLTFVAHCFVQDETCPLHIWHQYLFRKYCPLKTLNSAVIRLLEILHFALRLEDDDLKRRYSFLTDSIQHRLPFAGSPACTSPSLSSPSLIAGPGGPPGSATPRTSQV